MEPSRGTLVLTAGSLGDSLMTLPALHFLQTKAPVTIAGTFPYQALGNEMLGVDQVVPLEPLLQSLLTPGNWEPSVRDFLNGFSDIYLFFKDLDSSLEQKLSTLSQVRLHYPSQSFSDFLQEARWAGEYWLQTVMPSPLPSDPHLRQARLKISPELSLKSLDLLKNLGLTKPLVIHPGSGSPKKNAPLSFFRDAAQRAVTESNKQVLVTWGEAEERDLENIRQAFSGLRGVKVLDKSLDLRTLAGVLSVSAAYLGNDSGVTQLASACGLKTFAVFHGTDSRIWGPLANTLIYHWVNENLA
jgi:ADP-heptose:LPS heptosyltransferase